MTTKAVAEAPFKRERENMGFSFYLESESAGGQRVDKAGKGLLQVWKRQIQQLNRVSPDIDLSHSGSIPLPTAAQQGGHGGKHRHSATAAEREETGASVLRNKKVSEKPGKPYYLEVNLDFLGLIFL
ncbi:crossover junction endonuclease EME1-like [Sparus aurata]|uniref:crossover junction endonuclease EME1-like n=1 Tax=Sparus aurata TaxID=8175 RepID=UPI0011C17421|nr:crossover junction endonuclease EME1-like [Sparus aurata]